MTNEEGQRRLDQWRKDNADRIPGIIAKSMERFKAERREKLNEIDQKLIEALSALEQAERVVPTRYYKRRGKATLTEVAEETYSPDMPPLLQPEHIHVHIHIPEVLFARLNTIEDKIDHERDELRALAMKVDKIEAALPDLTIIAQATEAIKELNTKYDAERKAFSDAIKPTTP